MTSRSFVQQLLSTCQRCRKLRRKCDTHLPDCALCQKAGVECMLFDHAAQQALPRSYVQSLLARLEHLQAVQEAVGSPSSNGIAEQRVAGETVDLDTPLHDLAAAVAGEVVPKADHSFDRHFSFPFAPGRSRFFGASSVFTLTVEVLRHAMAKDILQEEEPVQHDPSLLKLRLHDEVDMHLATESYSQPSLVRALFRLFFDSSNTLYGILDETVARRDLEDYIALQACGSISATDLHGDQAHCFFRISMVCSIAAATQARYHPYRDMLALTFYKDALPCVAEVTAEVSVASLQALLLLTVFCLFYPRDGDIWKLLDYSCRLSLELGYHVEGSASEDEAQCRLRRRTFWGLYAIERIVGQLFGRASDLPEPIITAEYPSSVHASVKEPTIDQASFQSVSISHHYRLVYLRSEIFRDLYLPAMPVRRELGWYKERYNTLYNWRQELQVPSEHTGVATVTCDVGYHSSICFLFQPLLLEAVWRTGSDSAHTSHSSCPVPQDNYWSACALIRTYDMVMTAPENSALGGYPITFLSAHYIYLAGLTLMTHALLAIDGRIICYESFVPSGLDSPATTSIDFEGLLGVSNSCLVLLAFCARRWPGMEGMLSVYKKLADRCILALIRKGLIN